MLISDQQEKVLTTTPARSTSVTKLWRIPNNVNKEQRVNFRNQTLLPPTSQTMVHFRNQQSEENPNHNHRITTELHLRNQNLTELNLDKPHVIWSTSETQHLRIRTRHEPNTGVLPWIRLHILSGIGGKSQILTARILRRWKSRRRMCKPQLRDNRINRNRSWYKIGFNFYNKSSLQRTNYPSARHNDSAKVKHAYTTSSSQTKDVASVPNRWQHPSKTEPRTVMSEPLTNPDSQWDTQEAIQSERAKGTPLIQPS
jgi:hypothetical protein